MKSSPKAGGPWCLDPGMSRWPAPLLCLQDSVQLVDSARLSQQQEGTTYSLVLRNLTQSDAGVYTCLAQNAGGQVLCKAELLVQGGESGSLLPGPCSTRALGPEHSQESGTGSCPRRHYKVRGQGDRWSCLSHQR